MANPLVSMSAPLAKPVSSPNINMNAVKQAIDSAKRMMGMLQAVKDPQKALMMVAQQNPELNAALQMINGRSFQEVCIEEYKKYGIDPNPIVGQIRS